MKLKKLLCIAFAALFIVATSAIAIHAAHIDDTFEPMATCCPNYRGTSIRVIEGTHEWLGDGCQSWMESFCASCGTVFDTWYGSYNICPHYPH